MIWGQVPLNVHNLFRALVSHLMGEGLEALSLTSFDGGSKACTSEVAFITLPSGSSSS